MTGEPARKPGIRGLLPGMVAFGLVRIVRVVGTRLERVRPDGAVRKAMESGQFYFSTVSSHESDARDVSRTPAIEAIIHDVAAGTIAISAVEREPVDDEAYRWISAGEVVHVVPTSFCRALSILNCQSTPRCLAFVSGNALKSRCTLRSSGRG